MLDDSEIVFFRRALLEWGGSTWATSKLIRAMGFDDEAGFVKETLRLRDHISMRRPLSRADWTRVLVAAEVSYVSQVLGAGGEWTTITSIADDDAIRILRGIQRKLSTVLVREVLL